MTRGPSPDGKLPPPPERWFENYEVGKKVELGTFAVTEDEIVAFASHYDPQPMHLERPRPGGVIASGWHTVCLAMRLIAENYLPTIAGLPSPGVESLSWPNPVRPGDNVHLFAEVKGARISNSRPDRGIVKTKFTGKNQFEAEVLSFEAASFVRRALKASEPGRPWKLD